MVEGRGSGGGGCIGLEYMLFSAYSMQLATQMNVVLDLERLT